MKTRPILFSAAMVKAIFDGSKTQTRRIVKDATGAFWEHDAWKPEVDGQGIIWNSPPADPFRMYRKCPYGIPGDQLWVRETWAEVTGPVPGETAEEFGRKGIIYRADSGNESLKGIWKPSIFMPRSASRITIEVTNVRVDRLNDISDMDAVNEGIDTSRSMDVFYHNGTLATSRVREQAGIPSDAPYGERAWYAELWESINGLGSWKSNPWIWVITFKRIKQ